MLLSKLNVAFLVGPQPPRANPWATHEGMQRPWTRSDTNDRVKQSAEPLPLHECLARCKMPPLGCEHWMGEREALLCGGGLGHRPIGLTMECVPQSTGLPVLKCRLDVDTVVLVAPFSDMGNVFESWEPFLGTPCGLPPKIPKRYITIL